MENTAKLYNVIGIGIGPYNLGLAALLDRVPELDAMFFDETEKFNWHPGMLLEDAKLQVPFLADLTTLADPTSPFTYMNYLHEQNRLYQFYFLKEFEVPRQEYNDYYQWAAAKLYNLHFGYRVVDVIDQNDTKEPHYEVVTEDVTNGNRNTHLAKNVVMGTGSEPLILGPMSGFDEQDVFHTNSYLYEKPAAIESGHITIVGSGQSAAEVFLDLLKEQDRFDFHLTWLTRSSGIFQLEDAKLGQEFFSPDYIDYFHALSFDRRKKSLGTLESLRKGVDPDTLKEIYNQLYHKSVGEKPLPVTIQPLTEVKEINKEAGKYLLTCRQWQQDNTFTYQTEKVILATGYKPRIPSWFYERFGDKIKWEDDKRYAVTRDYQLVFDKPRSHHFFTLTNLEHSHGAGATNLGLAVHRNIHIINFLAGRTVYENQRQTIFQQFEMEDKDKQ